MTKVLSFSGNEVYIGHFQGNVMKKYLELVEEYSRKTIMISPKISVITAFTNKEEALTAYQLELSNMPYVNACPDDSINWTNVDKIKYFVEALEETTSEYVLLTDAYDVLFFKDLDETFISKFNAMGVKVLYNATKNKYPNFDIEHIDDREKLGDFKYLNAGVAFGKTSDLLKFYKEILSLTKSNNIKNPWNSEQLYVRIAFSKREDVGFDNNCELFQTFSKTEVTKCGNILIVA